MTDKTVSHAIERGIYFLFANRRFCGNEPRGRQPLDCGYGTKVDGDRRKVPQCLGVRSRSLLGYFFVCPRSMSHP